MTCRKQLFLVYRIHMQTPGLYQVTILLRHLNRLQRSLFSHFLIALGRVAFMDIVQIPTSQRSIKGSTLVKLLGRVPSSILSTCHDIILLGLMGNSKQFKMQKKFQSKACISKIDNWTSTKSQCVIPVEE
ncbi:uncharacterized protein [Rhodnius prolixus]|uniref:uncharacterized protein n=1 Tax=Rhodnius prolixus TaxID=13249 RepID=UPI003D18C9CD